MSSDYARLIFATDLDGTMVGHDHSETGLESFHKLWKDKLQPGGATLVFNTGRGLKAYLEIRDRHQLLGDPDWLICSNGCEIYKMIDGKYVLNKIWETFLSERFSKDELKKAMNKFDEVVIANLSDDDHFRHAITLQQLDQDPKQVKKRLERKFPNSRFHLKEACTWLSGAHLLEVYPANATKCSALDFVIQLIQDEQEFHTNLDVIWAGDAYNDKSLCQSDYNGIIVGNAEPALKKECERSRHYFASQHTALGVFEGLQHYGYVERNIVSDIAKVITLLTIGAASFWALRKVRGLSDAFLRKHK